MSAGLMTTIIEAPEELSRQIKTGEIALPDTQLDSCRLPLLHHQEEQCSGYVAQSLNVDNQFDVNTGSMLPRNSLILSPYGVALEPIMENSLFVTDFVGNQVWKLSPTLGILIPSESKGETFSRNAYGSQQQ